MDEPKQAEVVTIKEAVEKVKTWIAEKDYEKAKQGCEELLAVEKDNAEIKALLDEANQGLGGQAEVPIVKLEETTDKISEVIPQEAPKKEESPETPAMIMKTEEATKPVEKEAAASEEKLKPVVKKSFPVGKVILIVLLLVITGGLVFAFLQGWFNVAFEWILRLLGL